MKTKLYDNNKKLFRFPTDSGGDWQVVKLSSNANNSANSEAFNFNANNTSGAVIK